MWVRVDKVLERRTRELRGDTRGLTNTNTMDNWEEANHHPHLSEFPLTEITVPIGLGLITQTKGREEKSKTQRNTIHIYKAKEVESGWAGKEVLSRGRGGVDGPHVSTASFRPHRSPKEEGDPRPLTGEEEEALSVACPRPHSSQGHGFRPDTTDPKPSSPSHCTSSLLTGRRDVEEISRTYCP